MNAWTRNESNLSLFLIKSTKHPAETGHVVLSELTALASHRDDDVFDELLITLLRAIPSWNPPPGTNLTLKSLKLGRVFNWHHWAGLVSSRWSCQTAADKVKEQCKWPFCLEEAGVVGKHSWGLQHTRSLVHFHALLPYSVFYRTEHTMAYRISWWSGNIHSSRVGFGCGCLLGDVKSPRGSADASEHVKVLCQGEWLSFISGGRSQSGAGAPWKTSWLHSIPKDMRCSGYLVRLSALGKFPHTSLGEKVGKITDQTSQFLRSVCQIKAESPWGPCGPHSRFPDMVLGCDSLQDKTAHTTSSKSVSRRGHTMPPGV